jgi:prepilin signal peptidase PulO-like enzyme (type II secretory pathway)
MDILLGALIGGGIMLMVAVLGGAAFRKEVMGFGDVKLAASIGLVLGLKGIVFTLIFASLTSGISAAISLARRTATKEDAKPLGPFLSAGGVIYIFIIWPFLL